MSMTRVVRELPTLDIEGKRIIMPKAHLDLNGRTARLSGPGHGGNINALILETNNSYAGADYDLRLVVLAEWGVWHRELFQKETWYVTFLTPGAVMLS